MSEPIDPSLVPPPDIPHLPSPGWILAALCLLIIIGISAAAQSSLATGVTPLRRRGQVYVALSENEQDQLRLTMVMLSNLGKIGLVMVAFLTAQMACANTLIWLHYLILGTLLFVLFNLVEAFARGIGRSHPREVHFYQFPILLVLQAILMPIQKPLFFWRRGLIALLVRKIPASPGPTIEQEIQNLAEKTGVLGELDPTERELIREVFDFSETVAREVMTPRVDIVALPGDATVGEAISVFIDSGFSRLPIYERDLDRILGVILSKDLLPLAGLPEELEKPISNFLHEVHIVPETKRIGEALKDLQTNRLHLAVVVDEYGGTAGILTLEDILEELVGEIHDEHDHDEEELVMHTQTGAMLLDARLPIEEVPPALNWPIPESDQYETIGGYIISELGRIPEQGEEIRICNLSMVVEEADSRHLVRLRVMPDPSPLHTEEKEEPTPGEPPFLFNHDHQGDPRLDLNSGEGNPR